MIVEDKGDGQRTVRDFYLRERQRAGGYFLSGLSGKLCGDRVASDELALRASVGIDKGVAGAQLVMVSIPEKMSVVAFYRCGAYAAVQHLSAEAFTRAVGTAVVGQCALCLGAGADGSQKQ